MVPHRQELRSHTRFDPPAWLATLLCPSPSHSVALKIGGLREVLVIESRWVRRTGSRRVVFGGEESPVSIGNRAG